MKEANHSAKAIGRRSILKGAAVAAGSLVVARRSWAQGQAPAVVPSDLRRPVLPYGVQSGDVTGEWRVVRAGGVRVVEFGVRGYAVWRGGGCRRGGVIWAIDVGKRSMV